MKGWYKESYRHYLARKGVKTAKRAPREFILGGLADGKRCSEFPQDQLKKGIKVEMEHTNDPKIAREIAKDHLTEDPKYYDHLEEMEKKYMADKRYFSMMWETMLKKETDPYSKSLQKLIDDPNYAVSKAAKEKQEELLEKQRLKPSDPDYDEIMESVEAAEEWDPTPSADESSLIAEMQYEANTPEEREGYMRAIEKSKSDRYKKHLESRKKKYRMAKWDSKEEKEGVFETIKLDLESSKDMHEAKLNPKEGRFARGFDSDKSESVILGVTNSFDGRLKGLDDANLISDEEHKMLSKYRRDVVGEMITNHLNKFGSTPRIKKLEEENKWY